jgi:hypothetical protein
MDFLQLALAFIGLATSAFTALGHVGSVCVHTPVAIHASANAGFETDPTAKIAVVGNPTC